MKLNRIELKKIMYDFNSISNRLMQADFDDYHSVLTKFIGFLNDHELIHDYIVYCGVCEQDLQQEFDEVTGAYGDAIFTLGDTDEEEVNNVYAILSHIVNNNIEIHYGVAMGYSSSNKFQDKVKGFNDRVVLVLIRHIERYLTKIGIDMGLDDKVTYSISVENGQVNIANDNAVINATSTVNAIDTAQLLELIKAVKAESGLLTDEDQDVLDNSLEVIQEEFKMDNPRKSFIKTALVGINAIKGTAEFMAAVAALIQFIQMQP